MIVPLIHRVLIKVDVVETKTASGIVLAVNEKREQAAAETGTVIAIGDTAFQDFKAEVVPQIGDKVYFAKYAGKVVKDSDGTEYTCVNDEDICAIIKNV